MNSRSRVGYGPPTTTGLRARRYRLYMIYLAKLAARSLLKKMENGVINFLMGQTREENNKMVMKDSILARNPVKGWRTKPYGPARV